MGDTPPNVTLYVRNLPDKVKKDETKKLLYALFGQFGKVIDVVVMRREGLRGQAWVVFGDLGASSAALRAMDGFPFWDRPMAIEYARGKSQATERLEGGGKRQKRVPGAAAKPAALSAKPAAEAAAVGGRRPAAAAAAGEGNKMLFVENLPEATTDTMLALLFEQFPGYREARLVPNRPGIGFVDFETAAQAGVALAGLQGFKITPQHEMKVSFAKAAPGT